MPSVPSVEYLLQVHLFSSRLSFKLHMRVSQMADNFRCPIEWLKIDKHLVRKTQSKGVFTELFMMLLPTLYIPCNIFNGKNYDIITPRRFLLDQTYLHVM